MKKIILITILTLSLFKGIGQTFAEWTQQKKTQIKYLEQQIVGLQLYIGFVQKGYKIERTGLTAISDIKNGDFHLHNDYFNSLVKVNPKVRRYSRIADIFALQLNILKTYKKTFLKTKENALFTFTETSFIQNVFTKLLNETSDDITQLMAIISPGEFAMKDDDRFLRLDNIYDDMQDKESFAQYFSNEISVLEMQRWKEDQDIEMSRALNEINK